MRIMKSILGIISFMLFLMGVIYGSMTGAYISSAAIFLMLYSFGVPKWLAKKIKIELNFPTELLLIGSIAFIYLSFWESTITIYNVIMTICCTLLSWLFLFYLNISSDKLNIAENLTIIKEKYKNYKNPPQKLLTQTKLSEPTEDYQKELTEFFHNFNQKVKYKESIHNSWLLTYKFEIESGTKINDILELENDLELKIKSKVEVEISHSERNTIYIKIPRKSQNDYHLIHCIESTQKLEIPLGETDEKTLIKIDLQNHSPLLLIGEVGSGKTNLLNVIINTYLLNNKPTDLNFILIDKQQTGLDIYQNLPHLVLPLLNDPTKVLDYLERINIEIERRTNEEKNYPPLVVIIDEIFDIKATDKELQDKLEPIILYGKKVSIYLIIATSITTSNPLMDYLFYKSNHKIYFYGRNKEEYNPYQNKITTLRGLINTQIEDTNIRIRTPKIEKTEIKNITENAKGIQ